MPSFFRVALVPALLACVACGAAPQNDESSEHAETIRANSAPPEWDRAVTRPPSEEQASRLRRSCTFKRGAMPAESLGQELRVDHDLPIKNVVVLMQENRSFDSYF